MVTTLANDRNPAQLDELPHVVATGGVVEGRDSRLGITHTRKDRGGLRLARYGGPLRQGNGSGAPKPRRSRCSSRTMIHIPPATMSASVYHVIE